MKYLSSVLKFLSGKKSTTASVIVTVCGYLAARGVLGENEMLLVGGLVTIIFGGASYATGKIVYNK